MDDIEQQTANIALIQSPSLTKKMKKKQAPKKRFKCTFENCSKDFSTSGHLTRHSKIHTGEKTHICPILGCDSRFSRKDNMMQHFNAHKKKLTLCEEEIVLKSEDGENAADSFEFTSELVRSKPEKNSRSCSISSLRSTTDNLIAEKRSRAITTNSIPNLDKEWKPYSPVTPISEQAQKLKFFASTLHPLASSQPFDADESESYTSIFQTSQSNPRSRERMVSGASTVESSQEAENGIVDFQTQAQKYASADSLSSTDYFISRLNSTSANTFSSNNNSSSTSAFASSLDDYSGTLRQSFPSQTFSKAQKYQPTTFQDYPTSLTQNFPASSFSQNFPTSTGASVTQTHASATASNAQQFSPLASSNLPQTYSYPRASTQDYSPTAASNPNYTTATHPKPSSTSIVENYSPNSVSQNSAGQNYSTNQGYSLGQNYADSKSATQVYPSTSNFSRSYSSPSQTFSISATASSTQNYPTPTSNPQSFSSASTGNQSYSTNVNYVGSQSGQNQSPTSTGVQSYPSTNTDNQSYSKATRTFPYSSTATNFSTPMTSTHFPSEYTPVEYDTLSFRQFPKSTSYPTEYQPHSGEGNYSSFSESKVSPDNDLGKFTSLVDSKFNSLSSDSYSLNKSNSDPAKSSYNFLGE